MSMHTIQCHLQQNGTSARRSLLHLSLSQNHRHLCRQWCDKRWTWSTEWKDIFFTDESYFCLQHHDGQIRVWRHHGERLLNYCLIYYHTSQAPNIMVWSGIGIHSCTLLVRIVSTLNNQRYISEVLELVLPYLQSLPSATSQDNNEWPHVAGNVQPSNWIASLICLFSWSIANQKRLVDDCRTTGPGYIRLTLAIYDTSMGCYTLTTYPKPLWFNAEACSINYSHQWWQHWLLILSSSSLHKRLYFQSFDLCTTCYLPNKFGSDISGFSWCYILDGQWYI